MTKATFGVPQIVRTPIEIPGPLRSGMYRDVLVKVSELEVTSKEKGLAPHMLIPFGSANDTKKFLTGLAAARRRAKGHGADADLLNVRYMRIIDKSKGKFEVLVWHEHASTRGASNAKKK